MVVQQGRVLHSGASTCQYCERALTQYRHVSCRFGCTGVRTSGASHWQRCSGVCSGQWQTTAPSQTQRQQKAAAAMAADQSG